MADNNSGVAADVDARQVALMESLTFLERVRGLNYLPADALPLLDLIKSRLRVVLESLSGPGRNDRIGDQGQRYEVRFTRGRGAFTLGWTDDETHALDMADAWRRRADIGSCWVFDRTTKSTIG